MAFAFCFAWALYSWPQWKNTTICAFFCFVFVYFWQIKVHEPASPVNDICAFVRFGPARQVWRYLSDYARVASMPKQDMFDLQQLLTAARSAHAEWRRQSQRCDGTDVIVGEIVLCLFTTLKPETAIYNGCTPVLLEYLGVLYYSKDARLQLREVTPPSLVVSFLRPITVLTGMPRRWFHLSTRTATDLVFKENGSKARTSPPAPLPLPTRGLDTVVVAKGNTTVAAVVCQPKHNVALGKPWHASRLRHSTHAAPE